MFIPSGFNPVKFNFLASGSVAVILGLCGTLLPQSAMAACSELPQELNEKICALETSAQLWNSIEAQIEKVTTAQPEFASALAQDQISFTTLLEAGQNTSAEVIETALQERLAFLNAINLTPQNNLAGLWQNAAGRMSITEKDQSALAVQISAANPLAKEAVCEVAAQGNPQGNFLILDIAPSDEVTVSLAGQSGVLGVDYTRAGRIAHGPLHCENAPAIDGWYFRLNEGH